MALQGLITFPGLKHIERATITLSAGITPSQATFDITPQESVQPEGPITIREGSTFIHLPDWWIDHEQLVFNSSGQIVQVSLVDRRWKWRYGRISGQYNLREADGKIVKDKEKNQAAQGDAIADTEKTPQELATLCLEEMGESQYDVKDLPNEARPTRNWDGDNPAQALQELCEELGCIVVLQLDNKVAIRKAGVGATVPPGPVESFSSSTDRPEAPSSIIIRCAPTQYNTDLELWPVGLDIDGKTKELNDLTYAPNPKDPSGKGGFSSRGPYNFAWISNKRARECAQKSVWKWYRVFTPTEVKGYDGKIKRLRQILPIRDTQNIVTTIAGADVRKKAWVWGHWNSKSGKSPSITSDEIESPTPPRDDNDAKIISFDYQIDTEHGIVKFGEPVYLTIGSAVVFARIHIRCAVSVRDLDTGAWLRHFKERQVPNAYAKTKPRYVTHEEIVLNYNEGEEVNRNEADQECDHYLDALVKEYDYDAPLTVTYVGFGKTELDGALRSITWIMDERGATTILQRNDDRGSLTTVPYKIRRFNERQAKAAADTKRNEAAAAAATGGGSGVFPKPGSY